MARLSKETWERLKADFVTKAYTLEVLAKKYGVSKGAISQRAKKEKWKQLEIEDTAELVELEKLKKTKKTKLKTKSRLVSVKEENLKEAIEEITDYQTYIHNLQLIATEKIKETLQNNSVEEIATVSGEMGQIEVVDRKLNPREIKSLVDAIDKAGQTLGVVPRFGQQVNIQNNQTVENKVLKVEFIEPKS